MALERTSNASSDEQRGPVEAGTQSEEGQVSLGGVSPGTPVDSGEAEKGVPPDPSQVFDDVFDNMLASEDGETPPEIQEILDENGLSERSFRCMLKELGDEDTGRGTPAFIGSWGSKIPTYDWVGRIHGPGHYRYVFQWTGPDGTGRKRNQSKTVDFAISDKYQDEYELTLLKRMQRKASLKRNIIRSARFKSQLEDGILGDEGKTAPPVNPERDALEYIEKHMKINQMMGLGGAVKPSFDFVGALTALVPLMPALFGYLSSKAQSGGNSMSKLTELMMLMQQKQMDTTVSLMKSQQPQSGTDMMKSVLEMIMGGIDIKSALNQKESVTDRIFDTVQGVLPMIMTMATMPRQQVMASPQGQMAKTFIDNNPDMQQMKEDPAIRNEAIHKFDRTIGWEQTDMLLAIATMERPDDCPRIESQQYADGDPRNEAIATDAEVSTEPPQSPAPSDDPMEGLTQ